MRRSGTVISFLCIEPHAVASRTLAGWFEQETGTRVEVHLAPYADITARATQDVTSGAGQYDVVEYWYPMLGSLAENGVLLDVSAWWEANTREFQADDLIAVFRDSFCLVGRQRYGVPYDGDMHLLFYNTALFDKHKLEPPETWDEYLEVSRTITEAESGSGVYGCGIMAAKIPLILIGTYLNRLASFGGGFFDAGGMPTINTPEAVAALEHLVEELPYAVPEPTTVGFDEMLGPWLGGRVGMVEFWADLGKMTDNPEQSAISQRWGVVPLPRGPAPEGRLAAPLNAGWSLGVPTTARQRDLALEFLKFSLGPEINVRICTMAGGLDPIRWTTYDAPGYREYATGDLVDAARAAVQSAAVAWPTHARWPELQDLLSENLSLALTKAKTPKQALDHTQAAWQRTLQPGAGSGSRRDM